jgi:cell division topological specificity factor
MDIRKVFGRDDTHSKEIAKERLRMVLVTDRATVDPRFMEVLRDRILGVITDFMEIDESGMEVRIDHRDNQVALHANIPIRRMKRNG